MNTNNNQAQSAQNNYEVIDQFFAAQVACNESEATLKTLRPQVEAAVQALIAEKGLPKTFTGTIDYHGFKIVVSRPKSFTWEKNDLKRTAEKLEKAHPESESIKHAFRLAFVG